MVCCSGAFAAFRFLPGQRKVIAQLYKLLIYEEGDFFHAHVDTQRSDSMFGTMTVSLPVSLLSAKVIFTQFKRG